MIAPRYHKHFYNSGYADLLAAEVMQYVDRWFETDNLILDLGCGTGWDTLQLAENGYRLISVDAHKAMIEQLRYKVVSRGMQNRICTFIENPEQPRPYHRIRLEMKEQQPKWQDYADGVYSGMGVIQTIPALTNLGAWLYKTVLPNGLVVLVLLNPNSYSLFASQIRNRRQIGPWNRRRGEAGLNTRHSRAVKWMGSPADIAGVWNPWFELVDVHPAGEGLPPFESINSKTKLKNREQLSAVQRILNKKNPARFSDWLVAIFKRRAGRSSMKAVAI